MVTLFSSKNAHVRVRMRFQCFEVKSFINTHTFSTKSSKSNFSQPLVSPMVLGGSNVASVSWSFLTLLTPETVQEPDGCCAKLTKETAGEKG